MLTRSPANVPHASPQIRTLRDADSNVVAPRYRGGNALAVVAVRLIFRLTGSGSALGCLVVVI